MEKKKAARVAVVFGAIIIGFLVLLFAPIKSAHAATLYLSPQAAGESAGQSFTVNVDVSSADQAMNAAQGVIEFPTDKLEVISLSTADSVITLWVQPPSFSNKDGVIDFQGVAVNPGFEGSAGKILTIKFRAKAAGSAAVTFTSGSVLANDGKGTNILTALTSAVFVIAPVPPPRSGVPAPSTPAPATLDHTPPDPFTITEIAEDANDPTDPQPTFTWHATDTVSGIDHYRVKIGDGDWFDAALIRLASGTDLYELPLQAPGQHIPLLVDAYDGAGNMTEATTSFSISAIPAPEIVNYSQRIVVPTQMFQVQGKAPKGARIQIYLSQPDTNNIFSFSSQADESGNWDVAEKVNAGPGLWVMKVQAVDTRGAVSVPTAEEPVSIGNWFTDALAFLAQWASVIIAVIFLLSVITGIVYLIHYRYRLWRVRTNRELLKVRRELREDLKAIKQELEDEKQGTSIDLSPAMMRKRQERIQKEIEHIEADLKKETKAIDEIEKDD